MIQTNTVVVIGLKSFTNYGLLQLFTRNKQSYVKKQD